MAGLRGPDSSEDEHRLDERAVFPETVFIAGLDKLKIKKLLVKIGFLDTDSDGIPEIIYDF